MIQLNHVLVATDFGATSDAAMTYGRSLARAFGANLHVLHVVHDLAAAWSAEYVPPSASNLQQEMENAARARLSAHLTDDDRDRLHATAIVRTGASPAAAIVEYAKEAHVDLIVVGTHGRGPVSHLFMGSVAEKVVRTAPCPVLAVRSHEHEFVVPDSASAPKV